MEVTFRNAMSLCERGDGGDKRRASDRAANATIKSEIAHELLHLARSRTDAPRLPAQTQRHTTYLSKIAPRYIGAAC